MYTIQCNSSTTSKGRGEVLTQQTAQWMFLVTLKLTEYLALTQTNLVKIYGCGLDMDIFKTLPGDSRMVENSWDRYYYLALQMID